MNRKEIINQLKSLAIEANKNEDTKSIAGILYGVCGSAAMQRELELFNHITPHLKKEIEFIEGKKAELN